MEARRIGFSDAHGKEDKESAKGPKQSEYQTTKQKMQDATRCALPSPGFSDFTSPASYRFVLAGLGFPRPQQTPRGTIWLVIRAAATSQPRETWQLTITVTAPCVSSCIREGIRAGSPRQDRRPTITA